MPRSTWQPFLWFSTLVLLLAALLHLLLPLWGPHGYAAVGAPPGLVWMAQAGLWRPVLSCIVIAAVLVVAAVYGLSALGRLRRLPLLRPALAVIGLGLLARGLLFVPLAHWRPELLARVCGRCTEANSFVWSTSALCALLAIGYLWAAWQHPPRPLRS